MNILNSRNRVYSLAGIGNQLTKMKRHNNQTMFSTRRQLIQTHKRVVYNILKSDEKKKFLPAVIRIALRGLEKQTAIFELRSARRRKIIGSALVLLSFTLGIVTTPFVGSNFFPETMPEFLRDLSVLLILLAGIWTMFDRKQKTEEQ